MQVTEKDVSYVAELANLDLKDEERFRMVRDLNSILEHVDSLNELDTSNVAPMSQVCDRYAQEEGQEVTERVTYSIREDIGEGLRKSFEPATSLANAPDSDGTFFRVPKVIER